MELAYLDVKRGGFVEQGEVVLCMGIVSDPKLVGMEVAQDGGKAAHVVGVRVAQRNRVKVADAARPECGRDNIFADVEVLRGLARAAAEAAAVDEQSFAVGRDEEQ